MYIDSCIIVKLLSEEPDSSFFDQALKGQPVSSSELAVTEVFAALLAKERANRLSERDRRLAWLQFEEWIQDEQIILHRMDLRALHKARQQLERCHPKIPLRTLDAIHIAACDLSHDYPLVTTDGRMRQAAQQLRIPLFPEKLPSDNL